MPLFDDALPYPPPPEVPKERYRWIVGTSGDARFPWKVLSRWQLDVSIYKAVYPAHEPSKPYAFRSVHDERKYMEREDLLFRSDDPDIGAGSPGMQRVCAEDPDVEETPSPRSASSVPEADFFVWRYLQSALGEANPTPGEFEGREFGTGHCIREGIYFCGENSKSFPGKWVGYGIYGCRWN